MKLRVDENHTNAEIVQSLKNLGTTYDDIESELEHRKYAAEGVRLDENLCKFNIMELEIIAYTWRYYIDEEVLK